MKPAFDPEGHIIYVPNPGRKPYVITDNQRGSPIGFGVQRHEKTYIIQHRMDTGQRTATGGKAPQEVIRAAIGNVSDFANIDQARETARKFAQTMKQTKQSPNAIRKEINVADYPFCPNSNRQTIPSRLASRRSARCCSLSRAVRDARPFGSEMLEHYHFDICFDVHYDVCNKRRFQVIYGTHSRIKNLSILKS
nr:hypothetical protein [Brenneria rubrifaciens]